MIPPFDIFRKARGGPLLWCAAATTIEEAKAQARALMELDGLEYVIFSQKTGNRIAIGPDHNTPADPFPDEPQSAA